jgi:hypothetical protein
MAVINAIVLGDGNICAANYFTAPPMLTKLQVKQITSQLEGWIASIPHHMQLMIKAKLRPLMKDRMMRPLWCCPCPDGSVDWIGDYAEEYVCSHVSERQRLNFLPVVLLSCSVTDKDGNPATREFQSWSYIQGAGDDEEHWAPRGFTSSLFWSHKEEILSSADNIEVYTAAVNIASRQQESNCYVNGSISLKFVDILNIVPGLDYARLKSEARVVVDIHEVSEAYCGVIMVGATFSQSVDMPSMVPVHRISADGIKEKDMEVWITTNIKESLLFFAHQIERASTLNDGSPRASVLLVGGEDEISIVLLAAIVVAFYESVYKPVPAILAPVGYDGTFEANRAVMRLVLEPVTAGSVVIDCGSLERGGTSCKHDIKMVLLWLQLQLPGVGQICNRDSMKSISAFFVRPAVCDGEHWWTQTTNR